MSTKAYQGSLAIGDQAVGYKFNQAGITASGVGQMTDAMLFGDALAEQYIKKQYDPNVESALTQLGVGLYPINSVLITTSATSPSGVSFQENITVTGVPTGNYVNVYGIEIAIEPTDSIAQIVQKIEAYFLGTDLFRSVTDLNDGSFRITHKDNMRHVPYSWEGEGITMTGEVYQQSDVNNTVYYGTWDLLGSETKFTTDMYYWKRTA